MACWLLQCAGFMDDELRECVRQVRELLERLRSEAAAGAQDQVVADLRHLLPEVRRLRIETWGEPLPHPTWDEILPRPLPASESLRSVPALSTRARTSFD